MCVYKPKNKKEIHKVQASVYLSKCEGIYVQYIHTVF